MNESVERLVSSAKAGLNAVIQASACLDWAWKAALAGAAAMLPLRFLGLGREGLLLWAFLVAGAALAGYLRSLPRRLDSAKAARWVDERLGDGELISAALVCMGREPSGAFDREIVDAAEAFAAGAPKPRIPLKPIARKAAWVSALCLACLALLSLAGPARPRPAGGIAALEGRKSVEDLLKGAAGRPDAFQGKEAKDLAYRLFPEDKRMASLVERALQDGRIDDLRKLLERAEREYEKRLEQARSELERQAIQQELSLFQKAMRQGLGGDQSSGSDQGQEPQAGKGSGQDGQEGQEGQDGQDGQGGNPGQYGPNKGSPQDGLARQDPGSRGKAGDPGRSGPQSGKDAAGEEGAQGGKGSGGEDSSQKPDPAGSGENPSDQGSGKSGGGKVAGTGIGADVLKLDKGRKPGSGGSLELGEDDQKNMREMVLPDSKAGGTARSVAFDAARSAESAVSRSDLPLEYRDFAKWYFIRLTEGGDK